MKIINNVGDVNNIKNEVFLHYTGYMLGISCKADSTIGINRINQLKERSDSKGLIMLCDSLDSVFKELHISKVSKKINRFLTKIWPGNITVVLENKNPLYQQISKENKVAIRIPDDPLLLSFIKMHGPIVSTSVNKSGLSACFSMKEIYNDYSQWFDFALLPEGFEKAEGTPSTLVDIDYKENYPQIEILRQGSFKEALLMNLWDGLKISFACIGNICRSPIAEYYAKHCFKIYNEKVVFSSCGLMDDGVKISKNSEIVLKKWGIESSAHRSRRITGEILADNDYILTMTSDVKNRMLVEFPNGYNKIFTFGEITGFNKDIEDPYGMDLSYYEKTALQIKQMVDKLNNMIQNNEI